MPGTNLRYLLATLAVLLAGGTLSPAPAVGGSAGAGAGAAVAAAVAVASASEAANAPPPAFPGALRGQTRRMIGEWGTQAHLLRGG